MFPVIQNQEDNFINSRSFSTNSRELNTQISHCRGYTLLLHCFSLSICFSKYTCFCHVPRCAGYCFLLYFNQLKLKSLFFLEFQTSSCSCATHSSESRSGVSLCGCYCLYTQGKCFLSFWCPAFLFDRVKTC